MKRLVLVLVLLNVTAGAAESLDDYRWKHRLLLVFGETSDSTDMLEFREMLRAARCELEVRDLLTGWLFADEPPRIGNDRIDDRQAQAIRGMARPAASGVTVVLVGKDGGVKSRYAGAPSLTDVFALIDGMPMRRAETRSRALNGPDDDCPRTDGDGDGDEGSEAGLKREHNE